jgi:hypothetical protein
MAIRCSARGQPVDLSHREIEQTGAPNVIERNRAPLFARQALALSTNRHYPIRSAMETARNSGSPRPG